jgi:hypothetical protein
LGYLLFLAVVLLFSARANSDPIDNIATLLRQGDTHQLSQLFSPNVEIAMMNEENFYSRTQAGLMVSKFFDENKPKSVKIVHKVNSNPNYLFGVVFLNTDKGLYRVTFTLNKIGSTMKIIEMRIEIEKTK